MDFQHMTTTTTNDGVDDFCVRQCGTLVAVWIVAIPERRRRRHQTIIILTANFIRSHQKFSTQTRMIHANWLIEVSFTTYDNNVPTLNETEVKCRLKNMYVACVCVCVHASVGQHTYRNLTEFIQEMSWIYIVQVYFNFNFIHKILSRFVNAMICARKRMGKI